MVTSLNVYGSQAEKDVYKLSQQIIRMLDACSAAKAVTHLGPFTKEEEMIALALVLQSIGSDTVVPKADKELLIKAAMKRGQENLSPMVSDEAAKAHMQTIRDSLDLAVEAIDGLKSHFEKTYAKVFKPLVDAERG